MPKNKPITKLYIIAGDVGEVRLVETSYPEKLVKYLVTGRNHRVCAVLKDVGDVRLTDKQRLETFPAYMSQLSAESDVVRSMPRELRHDIMEYFAQLPHELDVADRALFEILHRTM
jgi:hypothetical protein